jgi:hypothetical protein
MKFHNPHPKFLNIYASLYLGEKDGFGNKINKYQTDIQSKIGIYSNKNNRIILFSFLLYLIKIKENSPLTNFFFIYLSQ